MPGTLTFKPLQANLKHDQDFIGKMNPYCKVKIGGQKFRGSVCKKGGKHPSWDDTIVVRRNDESACEIKLRDKNIFTPDSLIGACKVDLDAVAAFGRVTKWLDVIRKDKVEGQLLVEITYNPQSIRNL